MTIVNMHPLSEGKPAKIRVKLQGEKVTLHTDSLTCVLQSADGWYEITLPNGEGCYITIQ